MAGGTGDLDGWLAPFLAEMGRKTRRAWAPLYLRRLLGPGARKSVQPMAGRLGLGGHGQLQHLGASPAWDDAPLWTVLAREAGRLVGGKAAYLVIDDTALLAPALQQPAAPHARAPPASGSPPSSSSSLHPSQGLKPPTNPGRFRRCRSERDKSGIADRDGGWLPATAHRGYGSLQ